MKIRSLQARMLCAFGLTIVLCWLIALSVLVAYLSQSQSSVWDSKLRSFATRILLAIPAGSELDDVSAGGLQLRPGALVEGDALAFQVWAQNREVLAVHTPGAPATPLRPDFGEGFSSTVVGGQAWRVYSISDSTGSVYVQVGNLRSVVDAELQRKALVAMAISTLPLALMALVMWRVVRRALKPVAAVEAALRGRRSFDLTPLQAAPLPTELRPLVEAFNHLLGQLDQAVQSERRFIGDAAHELRTPLSALQAQAEVALRAETLAGKDTALVKLLAVAQRSTRLSEQLLDLARLDAGVHAPQRALADLSELILHVTCEFEVSAEQRRRRIFLATTPCHIECDIDEIGILLRNLIDNALRYTHEGGQVQVRCEPVMEAGRPWVCLEVADDGPGVPVAEQEAIFKRFHRVAGSGERGSGIGLSLVAGIAGLHGARIATGPGLDERGLGVRVMFPAPVPVGPAPTRAQSPSAEPPAVALRPAPGVSGRQAAA
ncbi:MAG TPA: ATP-binding protein [Ideonella sp.]|nr:ATP-binding protein [Ideonella sp.]